MRYVYGILSGSEFGDKYYDKLSETMLFYSWRMNDIVGSEHMFCGMYSSHIDEAMEDATNRVLKLVNKYPEMKEIVLTGYEIHDYDLKEIDKVIISEFLNPINNKLKAWR